MKIRLRNETRETQFDQFLNNQYNFIHVHLAEEINLLKKNLQIHYISF